MWKLDCRLPILAVLPLRDAWWISHVHMIRSPTTDCGKLVFVYWDTSTITIFQWIGLSAPLTQAEAVIWVSRYYFEYSRHSVMAGACHSSPCAVIMVSSCRTPKRPVYQRNQEGTAHCLSLVSQSPYKLVHYNLLIRNSLSSNQVLCLILLLVSSQGVHVRVYGAGTRYRE